MDNDDQPVGRILSRREVLMLLGAAAGAALLDACAPQSATSAPATTIAAQPTSAPAATTAATAPSSATTAAATAPAGVATAAATTAPTRAATAAATTASTSAAAVVATPSCVVKPALTEGPYFVDEKLNRSDVRSDPSDNSVRPGAQLDITLRVYQLGNGGCTALAGAQVDIWHCDALGVYSDSSDPNFGSTKGKKFLRGYQTTDANGTVKFTTVYPGWYMGRAVHIHFKIRTSPGTASSKEFTSQWFFNETLTDQVFAQAPYASKGQGRLKNTGDGIYQQSGGQTVLNVTKSGPGYAATFDIGMQLA